MPTPSLAHTLLTSPDAVGDWTLDGARTRVRILHHSFWGMSKVKGTFTGVTGSGRVTADHRVTGTITVDAASIDTKSKKRDEHLRSADFFEVSTHPTFVISVLSAAATETGLEVVAEFEAKGVREPITLTAEVTGFDRTTLSVHVTGAVDRHRFGISGNQLGMITGLTDLDIDAVFTRAG